MVTDQHSTFLAGKAVWVQ